MSKLPPPDRIAVTGDHHALRLDYPNGAIFELSAEYLRTHAPSADVRGHGGQGGQLVAGKRDVAIVAVERTGNYAVRIVFSDGHRNGLFTWKDLLDLALNHDEKWAVYLDRLEEAGQGRG
ncbi:MAG: 1-(5-phosphoribosyl)-5-((5-phosphoribosylamino)methylideneamino)imidazole-4-carboxamide isomerase [Gammaproteobacteria bacterium]|nr:MAG: 1-(5-phosphoribosyl)-5-((5-phosphoribosylamino)methylideneamino)imidazole-4-carboxamide isomerase [Gammaproteobacteria bacterium]